ncbi:hypothetical protein AKJ62_02345 [candidate division MSBL1 archaeon SCGC-AAA259D14]|uniref:HD/PDEase domain-containing protein n=1 Tax=candidate division MSBL1 archaeon SCGC-AAA259D14 TaxID=1698261 RepID=A0A133U6J3_9EURY|nr:hypothetical protein AKJ62_02345 [candidate division MSBL1 archaeon SCGC-AAA259D14]
MDPDRALEILKDQACSEEVIDHAKAVAEKSVEIAENISDRSGKVDVELIKIGALLHDIGRSRTHGIPHGVEGGRILREIGLEEFARFAENHLGAGITGEEAEKLGLPERDYLPNSLEEKIVTYADNLVRGHEFQTYEQALKELRGELGPEHPSIERFRKIHNEIKKLGGIRQ